MGKPNLRRRAPISEKLDDIDRNRGPPRERLRAPSSDALDAGYLTAVPDSRSALLVKVLQIAHKDHKDHKLNKDPEETKSLSSKRLSTKGRCIITISRGLSPDKTQIAYCETQVCDVIASNNAVDPHRVIYIVLPRPFFLCEENIFINRTADGKFGLPEPYSIRVELEATYNQYWPPSGVGNCDASSPSPRLSSIYGEESVLSNQLNQISGRHFLSLFTITHEDPIPTDYILEINVLWSTVPTPVDGLFPLKPVVETGNDDIGISKGAETSSILSKPRERHRADSLRALSDPEKRKRQSQTNNVAINEGRVSYLLPANQPICLYDYGCVACGATHGTIALLKRHLQDSHPNHSYLLEVRSQEPQFRVNSRTKTISSIKPFVIKACSSIQPAQKQRQKKERSI